MKLKLLLSFTFTLLMMGPVRSQVRPTNLYVDASFSGTVSDGSLQNPFTTIRAALDYRQALGVSGMTEDEAIIVKSGNYYPSPSDMIIINQHNSGYSGKWLTIKSEVPLGAIINGDSLYYQKYAAIVAVTDSAQYVRLEGFIIQSIRSNPTLATWKASETDMEYTASTPTIPIEIAEGVVAKNLFGETLYDGRKDVKYGIQVAMDARHIQILNNEVRDISWTSAVDPFDADNDLSETEKNILRGAWPSDNAGPISVLGSDRDAMENIIIRGNHVHHCIPGWTEAVTVNGYVVGFEISENEVHDIRNIGIVAAGNYTWVVNDPNFSTPASENYARNGLISGNKVYECRSPIAVSAGIYLDGSSNVVVEKNEVFRNHVGFSIGNETHSSHSGGHIIRNNISHHNHWAGMVLGSNGENAWVENVKVLGNTFADNNLNQTTLLGQVNNSTGILDQENGLVVLKTFTGSGEIILQKLSNSSTAPGAKIEIKNNIFKSRSGVLINALTPFRTDAYSSADLIKSNLEDLLVVDYNFYYPAPGENINYNFYGAGFTGNTFNFANYKNETGLDQNSGTHELSATATLPPFFTTTGNGSDEYRLVDGAAAINAGDPATGTQAGDSDFANNARIADGRVDIGAFEAGAQAAGDVAAAIDGVKSNQENYQALQTGVTQGVWKNIYAYDDKHFIYVYGEYEGSIPEYSIFINMNSSTGYQHLWTEKSDYYVDGKLNLMNVYSANGDPQWPFEADTTVMTIRFVKTDSTIEGRISKEALGVGDSGTVGIGIEGYSSNWSESIGSIPVSGSSMVYLMLDGGSSAGSLSIDGYKSPVEKYTALTTGVTGSSFSNLYGYTDEEYIYLYADISTSALWEYEVYINTNSATGFQYLWSDKSDYFIDANYNVLNEYGSGEKPKWPFSQAPSSSGIEFVRTPAAIEGKILKSLINVGNSGTIGIGLEGHTANWGSSLGGVPVSGNMVYLSLGNSLNERIADISLDDRGEDADRLLKIYPNPVSSEGVNISHYLEIQSHVQIDIIGMDGKRYYHFDKILPAGNYLQNVPNENLPKGLLLVRVITAGEVINRKIIVK
ncbi:right-handed parallel beta-helix repeat-containing protein [Cesiribacter sp. SM1]|uniref:right-handed parallel beta-helix repeat-containing protein n=1 Tax=Cesiribacter sp. SM1 TaxID=2861196 RepID=UPI001CD80088|nr:right-handed parallel beta-helix repeat-containing protein [Cesiribacter sp. SM1]